MKTNTSIILKRISCILATFIITGSLLSCSLDVPPENYQYEIERTSVKNQGITSTTCWAFAGTSFIESECIRKNTNDEQLDLSEAYVVYYSYLEKAKFYLEKMGENKLEEGGWSNDVLYLIGKYGIVREDDYKITESFKAELNKMPRILKNNNFFESNRVPVDLVEGMASKNLPNPSTFQQKDPGLMERLTNELDATIEKYKAQGAIPEEAMIDSLESIKVILNEELGVIPEEISYNGNMITPLYFLQNILGIHTDDYVHITSFKNLGFNHIVQLQDPRHPWYVDGQYINVDTGLFYEITRSALTMNYGLVIECKAMLEPGYHKIAGKADPSIYPNDMDYENIESMRVNRYLKGKMTWGNHLMHMVGFDETLTPWFLIKDSYGEMLGTIPIGTKEYRGYINMSKTYFLLKTAYVTVHKDMLEYFPEIK